MSLLSELKALLEKENIPCETGVFKSAAPDTYAVLVPIEDRFDVFADNFPETETQQVRISFFTKDNYTKWKEILSTVLLKAEITIEDRRYIGYETDTEYHHYAIDVAKFYKTEEI